MLLKDDPLNSTAPLLSHIIVTNGIVPLKTLQTFLVFQPEPDFTDSYSTPSLTPHTTSWQHAALHWNSFRF